MMNKIHNLGISTSFLLVILKRSKSFVPINMPKRTKAPLTGNDVAKKAKTATATAATSTKSVEKELLDKYKTKKEELCFSEVKGDLFTKSANTASLAHCVSLDFKMGAGIAVEFKKRFKGTGELENQGREVGQCAYLKRDDRYVFYLITKKVYNHKPNYLTLYKCLKDLHDLCKNLGVKELAMPRIGSGLDNLDWSIVSREIDDIFQESGIQITVYYL